MHRTATNRYRRSPTHRGAPGMVPVRNRLRSRLSPLDRGRNVTVPAHARAKDSRLRRGLIARNSAQFLGPIGGEHNERHARVMGLEYRRMQIGNRRARGRNDRRGATRFDTQAQCGEGAGAFINGDNDAQGALSFERCGGERQRLRPRAGTHHDPLEAAGDQSFKQSKGRPSCRRYAFGILAGGILSHGHRDRRHHVAGAGRRENLGRHPGRAVGGGRENASRPSASSILVAIARRRAAGGRR
ncbi:unannotated protein [freshwater metagenome]|uniref:Unannotated protein n=1 Tax=freshwater metagenome TaxID=449393 RepID=A0A6J7GDZ7_9ZZZZ